MGLELKNFPAQKKIAEVLMVFTETRIEPFHIVIVGNDVNIITTEGGNIYEYV
jgi:hypothetical protein